MKKLLAVALLMVATVAFGKDPASDSKITIRNSDSNGAPTFVTGELGKLGAGAADAASKAVLKSQKDVLGLN